MFHSEKSEKWKEERINEGENILGFDYISGIYFSLNEVQLWINSFFRTFIYVKNKHILF